MSIPRLELLGAELGVKLGECIADALDTKMLEITFWTDSADVLGWLSNRSRIFKPFVANRIGYIQNLVDITQWNYIESQNNPADIPSRGQSTTEFIDNKLCFLRPGNFDRKKCIQVEKLPELRLKENKIFLILNLEPSWKLRPERFSNIKRLMRIRSWVHRFIYNCRNSIKISGELNKSEVEFAQFNLIKESQNRYFTDEINLLTTDQNVNKKSSISALNPFLDPEGILRANSRIQYAETLNYDTKFPIILPKKDALTELIIKDQHEQFNHVGGTNQVLAALSQKFWINGAREEIRKWEKKCNSCKKQKAKISTQIMSNLPKFRLAKSLKAFTNVGVDFAGPFETKQGRGKIRHKRWLCLFTCLEIRAVHLELAFGLDTNSFLNAFFRFASRRGMPSLVISDNGTNFIKANKELKNVIQNLDKNKIIEKTSSKGVEWKFNPPSAPHFGRIFEIMIKAAKRAMNAQIKNAEVTDEELLTIIISVEHILNSRPLTYQTSNEMDLIPLTPNHFLHGVLGDNFAPQIDTEVTLLSRWKLIQNIIKQFWERFLREWVPTQIPRKKWQQVNPDPKVGDVVLVVDPDSKRGKYPLGRITKIFPSRDSHIRKVEVMIEKKLYIRPISRICILNLE